MKTYKEFLSEASGNSYKVSVVVDGKVQKSATMKYEAAMKMFQKAKDSGKAAAGDIDLDKMFKEVDDGKTKGLKLENRELNIALVD
jgi:hypothetical protein